MTPEEQRKSEEEQIKKIFSELQQELSWLNNEISDEDKADALSELTEQLNELQEQINKISEDTDLETLREELAEIRKDIDEFKQSIRWEALDLQGQIQESRENEQWTVTTPTTYKLLKDSETYNKLLSIISSNPNEFNNLEKDDEWNKLDTPEKKLEYIFKKIRKSIVLFMKNKLWNSEETEKIINNTIAPAFERNLMGLLHEQWNAWNTEMLDLLNQISWDNLWHLFDWIKWFADRFKDSYWKLSQWINALDYLSVHNWVLYEPSHSEVLSNPLKFQEYMNDNRFGGKDFSPYTTISDNIFGIDEKQNFEFGISTQDKQTILTQIWDIQIIDNPKTTSLIAKMIDKPEQILQHTWWLQETANHLLDWASVISSIAKPFWKNIDILWEIRKAPEERSWLYRIADFICKLIWITWGLEWIVKKRHLDKMNLTDEKNKDIRKIFEKYKEWAGENTSVSITDEDTCKNTLNDFSVTDPKNISTTKWDFLRDSIAEKMDISLISPYIIQQWIEQHKLWNSSLDYYLKKETIQQKDWNTKEITKVDKTKFTTNDKLQLAHNHLINMKAYLEKYNDNDLPDFYTNISSTEDIALCITASLYANKDDVIDWVKANVFLPENYGSVLSDWTVDDWWNRWWNSWWRENLDSSESSNKETINEQWIYDKAKEYWITDNRQIAYVLSTIKWESWFKNQKESWGENKDYWKVDPETQKAYYGRWFIPLRWKDNYQKYTQIIKASWKDFKDNDWKIIKWNEIDLVENPDIILNSNDLAAFIAMDRMKNWWPDHQNSRCLDHYIKDNNQDYNNARNIVNWMGNDSEWYTDTAQKYLAILNG